MVVRVHPLLLVFFAVYFAAGMLERAAVALVALLAHEMGHLLVARQLGLTVKRLEVFPFGGVTYLENAYGLRPAQQILLALAGPLASAAVFVLGLGLMRHGYLTGKTGQFFLTVNFLLAAFNLLPGLPLDGGRILAACLARKKGVHRATHISARLGQIVGLATFSGGILGAVRSWWGLDIAGVGLFLLWAATRELRFAPYLILHQILAHERELIRRRVLPGTVIVSLEEASLIEVARFFRPGCFTLVAVVNHKGECQGILAEGEIVQTLVTNGGSTQVITLLKRRKGAPA